MKHLHFNVEANDIVRCGQRQGVNISHDRAKELLLMNSAVIEHEINDVIDRNLVRIVAIEAKKRVDEKNKRNGFDNNPDVTEARRLGQII